MTLIKTDVPLEGMTSGLGERTVHPLASLSGWYGSSEVEMGGGGDWLQASPTEAIIHDSSSDAETRIPTHHETESPIRMLLFIALAIVVVSEAIILLTLKRRDGG